MAEHIQVDYGFLAELAGSATTAGDGLHDLAGHAGLELAHSPSLRRGYHFFEGDWDEKRCSLADGLFSLSQALTMISESFSDLDNGLAGQLQGGD